MSDILARMKQLIGSTAEWAANDIPLGYGEIGVERVSASEYKLKCGDGSTRWSGLPYISATLVGIPAAVQAALDAKLAIAGGTMTGELILAHDGAKPLEAVTYTQLQAEVTKLNTSLTGKLATNGGTLTGPIMLNAAATQPLEPVTFDQMNKAIQAITISSAGGLVFIGTIDVTVPYAAPVPAPTASGQFYTVAKAGNVHATWHTHLVQSSLATVGVGDYIVWNATAAKFDHVANSSSTSAYVPLAGTTGMVGDIVWSGAAGNKKGVAIISGKGGTIDDAVIDNGSY